MKVSLIFEGSDVMFMVDPEGEFESKLLLALSERGLFEGRVQYERDVYGTANKVRCVLCQKKGVVKHQVETTT